MERQSVLGRSVRDYLECGPRVPVRQWVLSFPYEMRYRLAYDGEWVSKVLAVFLRVVGRWYRRQAQAMGHDRARWGSVTFVQRFGSSLNLNPHIHVLMLDGVCVDGEEAPVFVPAPPLSDQAVQQIVETSARRIMRLCTKRGLLDDTAADPLADEEPVLAALTAASVRGLTATGARAGQRLRRVLKDAATGVRTAPLCFASRGFWLHAATPIAGPDRRGLERLCRYVARPALAGGASAHCRCRPSFLGAQNAVVGWDPPSPAVGSWRPGPGPATASCPPNRLRSRPRRTAIRFERWVLRPSAALGDPAGAGVFLRPQRMRGMRRSPENHRRPDRSGFDPDLSGGSRAAGDAPAESPASAAFRVRRLILPSRPVAVAGRTAGCAPNSPSGPGLIRITGLQATRPDCELGRRIGKRSSQGAS